MLISISGPQGSGKSTVIQELEKLGYPSIKRKTSRSILSEWGVTLSEVNNDRELTVKFQDEILNRKYNDELEARDDRSQVWVTERSFMDLFAYALIAIGKDNEYNNWLNEYYNHCRLMQVNFYDVVVYIKGGHFPPVHDGVRAVNQHYNTMVDLTISHFLKQNSQNLLMLDTPKIEERVELIKKAVDDLLLTKQGII